MSIKFILSFLYVCMVNTIYLLSFVETPRKFIIAIMFGCEKTVAKNSQSAFQLLFKKMTAQAGG